MAPIEYSVDGRFVTISGRRRRATDPAIPEPLREALERVRSDTQHRLSSSSVPDRDLMARLRDAEIALGLRGMPWWEDPDETTLRTRTAAAARTLRVARGATPVSAREVATIVAGREWRRTLELVAQELAAESSHADEQGEDDPSDVQSAIPGGVSPVASSHPAAVPRIATSRATAAPTAVA